MLVFYQLVAVIFGIVWIGSTSSVAHALGDGELNVHCIKSEEQALLEFKQGFGNTSTLLSSWSSGRDCCKWKGVGCNSTTGHVISLKLPCQNSSHILSGELSSCLLDLPYLTSLDLSGNDFKQTKVPEFLSSLRRLEHLDLSKANFKGIIPDQLGDLSQLQSLNLSDKKHTSLRVNNLKWLHGLSSLKILDLSGISISSPANENWYDAINMMPPLEMLHMSGCQLRNKPPSLPQINCDSLLALDLSFNYLNATIPEWLFENCHNLEYLDISNNQFHGQIPDSFENLMSLVVLSVSDNHLSGPMPSTLGQTSYLKELNLSNNHLSGTLNTTLMRLSELVVLDVAQNELEGVITDTHLKNLRKLKFLSISANNLIFNVSKNWVPSFQLEAIGLSRCLSGPEFPKWIQTQKNLSYIDLSRASISDTVPKWFWDLSPKIEYINLSNNYLRGCVHDLSPKLKLHTLDLSNNNFSCPLPHLPPKLRELNLAENSFFGNISRVCKTLGINNSLSVLRLNLNNLSGNLPNCWNYGEKLVILDLSDNYFSGPIPYSFGSFTRLHSLSLRNNSLSGEIPLSMKSCTQLIFLSLGNNKFSGKIPTWIGQELKILRVFSLRSNSFKGHVSTSFCQLQSLRIFDLSSNLLSGPIPRCVFYGMVAKEWEPSHVYDPYINYRDILLVSSEGTYLESFYRNLKVFVILDLSSNLLTGDIPTEFSKLAGLVSLNLSSNQLVGSIPSYIGQLQNLQALDLSRNQLSCTIPTSIVDLNFLAILNVSYNNLLGEIPTGHQMDTFDSSSYIGNPKLCGLSLERICPGNGASEEDSFCKKEGIKDEQEKHKNGLQVPPFYVGMAIGFITGFWGFVVPLIVSRTWRHAYNSFLEQIYNKLYVMLAIMEAKLKRKHFLATQQPPN
ncbi:hypothetical protein L6164_036226 [Bauhinia variegata]|uniref:Uncharacterized protein n=1 Tax=Bauhinia variegata TaxID=167791 RepID=A0ACB9KGC6_BAUVA|nr:hypothetical protein L6164_036226 [Bauhinia variegata]